MHKKQQVNTDEKATLFAELKSLSKLVNQRILRLERQFGREVWATKILREHLEIEPIKAWTKKGRVRASKKFSETQMRSIIKELKQFKKSKITTKSGIKEMRKRAIKAIKTDFGSDVTNLTDIEAESIYNFFEDKEVNKITNFIPRFRYCCCN